ncbi:MoaD family protein [Candidatus Bathyarchaeota archaeon]|nr:MoaD family protein [Candidatus Bathyarchaeota archaeon]
MKVSVRFFASLRELVGRKVEHIEFQNSREATVEKVLKRLSEIYGEDFVEYVFDGETGEVRSYLLLLVNGRSITVLDELETRLTDGDVLAILPPVGGG